MTSPYYSDNAINFRLYLSKKFSDLEGGKQFMRDYVLKYDESYPLEEFKNQTLSQYRLIGNISLTLDPQSGDVITSPRQARYFNDIESAYHEALKEKYS